MESGPPFHGQHGSLIILQYIRNSFLKKSSQLNYLQLRIMFPQNSNISPELERSWPERSFLENNLQRFDPVKKPCGCRGPKHTSVRNSVIWKVTVRNMEANISLATKPILFWGHSIPCLIVSRPYWMQCDYYKVDMPRWTVWILKVSNRTLLWAWTDVGNPEHLPEDECFVWPLCWERSL